VRPILVVIPAPFINNPARMIKREEPMLVEAFVPEPSVEALHVGVVNGLARTSKMKLHLLRIGLFVQSVTYELRAVVNHYALRKPAYRPHLG
jgi:hypothetical protein